LSIDLLDQQMKKNVNIGLILIYFCFGIVAVSSIFPIFWMVSISIQERASVYTYPPVFFPPNPILSNYIHILIKTPFLIWLKNSLIVGLLVVVGSVFTGSSAGYAFAKLEFYGRDLLFVLILITLMIPIFVIMVPVYIMICRLNMVDTYAALILPMVSLPTAIFIMRQYIQTIPNDLINAAKIDGCSQFSIFWNIVFPLCKPAASAVAILYFLSSWNNFIWPLLLTTDDEMRTLPVGIAMFVGRYEIWWGNLMAASILSFIPMFILFIILQKYFVAGVVLSGLKG